MAPPQLAPTRPIIEVAAISATADLSKTTLPSELLSAERATKVGARAYHVPMQLPMAAFLFATGPPDVVNYNLNAGVGGGKVNRLLVDRVPFEPDGKKSLCDRLQLTAAGLALLDSAPKRQTYRKVLACSAKSLYGKPHPNCQRECGGIGMCFSDCTESRDRHHGCTFRITITASLQNVDDGRFHVQLSGGHVPDGVWPVPPPTTGLKTVPYITRELATECLRLGSLPTVSVNGKASALDKNDSVVRVGASTRFVPPAKAVAGRVKRMRRQERGDNVADLARVDTLVREQLIQRQLVLLYIPGYLLALSTPFALERARCDGQWMVVSDAKVDTVQGVTSKWSSIRGKSADNHRGPTLGCGV